MDEESKSPIEIDEQQDDEEKSFDATFENEISGTRHLL